MMEDRSVDERQPGGGIGLESWAYTIARLSFEHLRRGEISSVQAGNIELRATTSDVDGKSVVKESS